MIAYNNALSWLENLLVSPSKCFIVEDKISFGGNQCNCCMCKSRSGRRLVIVDVIMELVHPLSKVVLVVEQVESFVPDSGDISLNLIYF